MAIRPLLPELQATATKILNEEPSMVEKDIKHIKEWLDKQPHLNARTDDQWILTFLRGCKFSLEKTKSKLDMFYTMRTLIPEFFTNRDPYSNEIQDALNMRSTIVLHQHPTEPTIVLVRAALLGFSRSTLVNVIKMIYMIIDMQLLEDDATIINGVHIIYDLKGITMSQVGIFTSGIMKKYIMCFQEGYPIRLKKITIINPSYFESIFNVVKFFLKDKFRKRIQIHNTLESLLEEIPKSRLPIELGGTSDTTEKIIDYWRIRLENHKDWFEEEYSHICDERKRPTRSKSVDEYFGIEGSFRNLNVD